MILSSRLKDLFITNPGLISYPDEVLALGLMYASSSLSSINNSDQNNDKMDYLLRTHVKSIPETFNSTIFWNEEEINELNGCNVFHLTNLIKNQIDQDWETLHKPLSEEFPDLLGHITKELYTWSLSVIYSRAVGIYRRGVYVRCIPPVLDMANHNPSNCDFEAADTFTYDEVNDTVNLVNVIETKPSEECFAVYGQYPNAKLAFTYGFIIVGNPHRAIDLWTRVPPTSFKSNEKNQILQNHKLTQNQTYDFNGTIRENYISAALLATIRIIQIDSVDELNNVENAFNGRMISIRNENATYTSLRSLLLSKMNVEQAERDKKKLGEILLNGEISLSDRSLMSLVIKVDERDLMTEILALIDNWIIQLQDQGELYIPFDAPK
jgi:hypothetical protein